MNQSKMGVIYIVRNSVNGKSYVGQTSQPLTDRFDRHCCAGNKTVLSAAIYKYGRAAFSVEVLEIVPVGDSLNRAEAECIQRLGTLVPHGYNVALGGHCSPQSPEVIERRIKPLRGMKRSQRFKDKLSAALKGRNITWGDKIREANKNRSWKMTEAHKQAFRDASIEALKRPEVLAKRKAEGNGRAVLTWDIVREVRRLYSLGGISQEALATRFGVKQTAISRVIRGVTWQEPLMREGED